MRRLTLLTMAVVFLIGAYAIAKALDEPRDAITAVATPPPIRNMTPITLEPGQRACQDDVALDPQTRVVRFYSGAPTPEVPRLRLTIRGDGYTEQAVSPDGVGPGTGGDGIYDTRITPPARSVIATVCVETAESRGLPAILAGSEEERVRSRSTTEIDGKPTAVRLGLVQLSGGTRSAASEPKAVLRRAAAFDPPFIGWFTLALLGLVTIVGVPSAAVYAALRAMRDDGLDPPAAE